MHYLNLKPAQYRALSEQYRPDLPSTPVSRSVQMDLLLPRCVRCWGTLHIAKCKNDDCPSHVCPAHNHGGRCANCWETGSIILPPRSLRQG
jgi:hypothetical protein